MKLILLEPLSGGKYYEEGEEIEASDAEALRFIQKGIAKAKTLKAHNDLMAKAEKLEKEAADKKAKLIAIQKEDELKGEADALLNDLVAIVTTIESINPEYRTEFHKLVSDKFKKGE